MQKYDFQNVDFEGGCPYGQVLKRNIVLIVSGTGGSQPATGAMRRSR